MMTKEEELQTELEEAEEQIKDLKEELSELEDDNYHLEEEIDRLKKQPKYGNLDSILRDVLTECPAAAKTPAGIMAVNLLSRICPRKIVA